MKLDDGAYFVSLKHKFSDDADSNVLWSTGDKKNGYFTVVNSSDVKKVEVENLKIYPNPTHDFVTIEGVDADIASSMFDLSGARVLESASNKIDLNSLSKGCYVLRINTDNGAKTVKVIKQ